jgi:flavin-dependent dehydrogenase
MYDVAVIGAGPAGLMAAHTAATKGLKAVVIEKQPDVSKIRRACCQQLVMDENYEQENIELRDGKLIFPNNGFSVDYRGQAWNITDTYFLSPRGHKIHFAYPDKKPVAIKFDKALLLQSLLEKCVKAGVEIRFSAVAYGAKESTNGVEVSLSCKGAHSTITARKVLAADGANSRIAQALGMNQERSLFTSALCIIYTLANVKEFDPRALKWHMGLAYHSKGPVILTPSLEGEDIADLVIMGNSSEPPEQIFHNFTTRSPLAYMYEKAQVIARTGCMVKAYMSMRVPYRGNALVIGDAAAYVEVETQGALMCGYHAGKAVFKELNGEDGFKQYTAWWQKSFEFNSDEYLLVAQGYALVPTYTDDELDYLFSLIEQEALDGAYGQYRAPRLMWDAILRHKERIAKEQPQLHEKIKKNREMTLQGTF